MTQDPRKALEALDKLRSGKSIDGEELSSIYTAVSEQPTPCEAVSPATQGWSGIESAPRDGTRVLLWMDGSIYFGSWFNNKAYPTISRWKVEVPPSWQDQPTHWLPLPSPPKNSAEGHPDCGCTHWTPEHVEHTKAACKEIIEFMCPEASKSGGEK